MEIIHPTFRRVKGRAVWIPHNGPASLMSLSIEQTGSMQHDYRYEVRNNLGHINVVYSALYEFSKNPRVVLGCSCMQYRPEMKRCKHGRFVAEVVLNLRKDEWYFERTAEIGGKRIRQLDPDDECPICLEPLADDNKGADCSECTKCHHWIHTSCIKLAFENQKGRACPLCREDWTLR